MVATSIAGPSGLNNVNVNSRTSQRSADDEVLRDLDQVEPMDIDENDPISSSSTDNEDDDDTDSDAHESSCLKTPLNNHRGSHNQHRNNSVTTSSHRPHTTVNFFVTDCDDEDDLDLDVIAIDSSDNYDLSRSRLVSSSSRNCTIGLPMSASSANNTGGALDDIDLATHEQYSITSNGSKRSLRVTSSVVRAAASAADVAAGSHSNMSSSTSSCIKPGTAARLHATSPHTITCRPISESSSVAQLSIASSCASDPSLPMCKICHLNAKDGDPLISPCRCAGTMQFIHCGCLMRWLEISSKKTRKPLSCELCQYQYHWHKKFKVNCSIFNKYSIAFADIITSSSFWHLQHFDITHEMYRFSLKVDYIELTFTPE